MTADLKALETRLEGELHTGEMMRKLYATDASVYRELPLAVALPRHTADVQKLIAFATQHRTSLIPRAAGTSLAGQCVGEGIVVDISKYMNSILEFNAQEGWVRVQPGVVRDELNAFLKPHGYFFSPITSTANRAMIGGMVGNNSCGTTSIVYGSTREHVLELKTVLADGNEVTFQALSREALEQKKKLTSQEGEIYSFLTETLADPETRAEIRKEFPKSSIKRRNTGYAVDYLLDDEVFDLCKLLCGSEGTLAFTTEIKLHLDPLPDPHDVVLAAHFESINDSMKGTQLAMQYKPTACELMDKIILDCTKENAEQLRNRYFVEGDPAAILMLEFRGKTEEEAQQKAKSVQKAFQEAALGYAFPIVPQEHTSKVWALRSAGLGLLANIPGDKKAVACIEDTSVDLDDLPDYIDDFAQMMKGFGQESVYYAHAGDGEIHLRPILDLKQTEDVEQFRAISEASAKLVKKYGGSLSGEHGDGRVRAEFIPLAVGEKNYDLFKRVKQVWDPHNIFNPGKIVEAAPMHESLRYEPGQQTKVLETALDFSAVGGIQRAAEKCNGSGDCRKLALSGGTMCPSYRATRNEKDTTRARANILREYLTHSTQPNPFDHEEVKAVMDLCLSCKGCASECPSSVDVAALKAEFLYQYQKEHGVPLRSKAFANIDRLNALGGKFPGVYNWLLKTKPFSSVAKRLLSIAPERSLPAIHKENLRRWFKKNMHQLQPVESAKGSLVLFCDEFTNWNDTPIGKKAVELLVGLGYEVRLVDHQESGRAAISKGLLDKAKVIANQNVELLYGEVSAEVPLVGIEPSAILSFRDEYPKLVDKGLKRKAQDLAGYTYTIEEFLYKEWKAGHLAADQFNGIERKVLLHGHCHQKALTDIRQVVELLSIPKGHDVELIPSGCCGMGGSFGYEVEHYALSKSVAHMTLIPVIEKAEASTVIVGSGTSCRHQTADFSRRQMIHPVELLHEALRI